LAEAGKEIAEELFRGLAPGLKPRPPKEQRSAGVQLRAEKEILGKICLGVVMKDPLRLSPPEAIS